jgi:cyclic pyranopterin phosphate synthase
MMKDLYGREVTSLRLSVTQKCNLNCFYCHNEGQERSDLEMTADEIEAIAKAASSLGIKKLKLTGGEPLVRQDIVEIVHRVSRHMDETSLVTNGVHLAQYAYELKRAGLARINIGLSSLDNDNYQRITGKPCLSSAIEGVQVASQQGFSLLKINMVVLRDVNEDEIAKFAQFCSENNLILQLIELEVPKEATEQTFYHRYHFDLTPLENDLGERAIKIKTRQLHHRKQYLLPWNKGLVTIEIVRSMHNTEFCRYCSRIRMTSDGKLKPCLWTQDGLVDIGKLMRDGREEAEIKGAFIEAIRKRKPYWQ